MTRCFVLLCSAVGLILIPAGFALAREQPLMLALVFLGAMLTYWGFQLDKRRVKVAAEAYQIETNLRTEALAKASWAYGKRLDIKTGRTIFLTLFFLLLLGATCIYALVVSQDAPDGMWVGGILFFLLPLFVLAQTRPSLWKPALVLSLEGFETPAHGVIPWREVGGIHFVQTETSAGKVNTLTFRVENYARAVVRIHWAEHLLGLFGLGVRRQKKIVVPLNGASEPPETVAAIARLLWEKSTGMNHDWNPQWSDAFNQAQRRVQSFLGRYKDPNAISEELLVDPASGDQMLRELEQFQQDMRVMEDESKRYMSKMTWQVAVILLGCVVCVIWQMLS